MMRPLIYITILLFVISCNSNNDKDSRLLYPEGFFSYERQLYFSDGKQFYCTFKNWEHLYALRGSKDKPTSKILKYDKLPSDMKFIKHCNIGILTKKFFN